MKLVIQRVTHAAVNTNGEKVGEIEKGLFVLLGVGEDDTEQIANKLAIKLSKLRIMSDEEGKMNQSVLDNNSPVLIVSQFTLFADTSKGNRPSFIKAGSQDKAKKLYDYFINKLRELGIQTESGSFGEYMQIDAQLDGPVTILIEEKNEKY